MAAPNSRDTIIDYALRNLGEPVITINVDREQCEDRLDEALAFFVERHFDGVEKVFFKYQITQTDLTNRYLTVSNIGGWDGNANSRPNGSDIVSVIKLFQFGNFANIDMFDLKYQLALVDYFGVNRGMNGGNSLGLASYHSTKQYIKLIEDFFQGEKALRFSKVTNRIHIDGGWDELVVGDYIVIEAYAALDPNQYTKIFNDRMLKRYLTALIKRQWGANMAKYDGVQLPGGIVMKGGQIYAEAVAEIQQLEAEFYNSQELPVNFFVG
jgi:hypothetical protein